MSSRSEPLLWLQGLAIGAIPLELLLIRLMLAGADPGPIPLVERLLIWGVGVVAPAVALWRRPADWGSLLVLRIPTASRSIDQQSLSARQGGLAAIAPLLFAVTALLPLLWWLDESAGLIHEFSPLQEQSRLITLLLSAPLLALIVWQLQQLVQAVVLLAGNGANDASPEPWGVERLKQERTSFGLQLLQLRALQWPAPKPAPTPGPKPEPSLQPAPSVEPKASLVDDVDIQDLQGSEPSATDAALNVDPVHELSFEEPSVDEISVDDSSADESPIDVSTKVETSNEVALESDISEVTSAGESPVVESAGVEVGMSVDVAGSDASTTDCQATASSEMASSDTASSDMTSSLITGTSVIDDLTVDDRAGDDPDKPPVQVSLIDDRADDTPRVETTWIQASESEVPKDEESPAEVKSPTAEHALRAETPQNSRPVDSSVGVSAAVKPEQPAEQEQSAALDSEITEFDASTSGTAEQHGEQAEASRGEQGKPDGATKPAPGGA